MDYVTKIDKKTYILDTSFLDEEKQVVSVKLKKSLIKKIDEAYRKLGFDSRSDFIRYCINKVLEQVLDEAKENEYKIIKVKIL